MFGAGSRLGARLAPAARAFHSQPRLTATTPFFKPATRADTLRQATRPLHSSSPFGARLGKITPRRVAVIDGEIVDGLPRPSIWRPIVVSRRELLVGTSRAVRLGALDATHTQALIAFARRAANPSSPSAFRSPASASARST